MKRPFSNLIPAICVVAMLSAPGCLYAPEFSGIRNDIEAQLPDASFDKEIELCLGPVALTLARVVTSVLPGAQEARHWLKGMSRVQIGVYDAHVESTAGLRMPERLQSLVDDGWETAVRVRENNEAVWVLYRADKEEVREMFVMVLSDDELVLVRAKGNLERLVAAVLKDGHGRRGFLPELGS